MAKYLLFILVPCFLLFYSCKKDGINEPVITEPIEEFIKSQNLPDIQPYEIILNIEEENLKIFTLKFGEPQDCESGCIYMTGIGLQYKSKTGWLYLTYYNESDTTKRKFYDIDSTETYLYSDDFWKKLDEANSWAYRHSLLHNLAQDKDTPVDVLYRIAEGLYTYINDYLGYLLLNNKKVVINREILTLLANLPVFQGDAYYEVRMKARELLEALGG